MTKKQKSELCELVERCYELAVSLDSTDYIEGQIGDCVWRAFGPLSDSPAHGQLHLTDSKDFDRWANSRIIDIHLRDFTGMPEIRKKEIIRKAFEIFI